MEKVCSICKVEGGTDNCGFGKDKRSKDSLDNRCKVCNNKKRKKYRQENLEKVKESSKKWYKENPNYYKNYYETNPEIMKISNKKWRQINPKKIKEANKKWYQENPEKSTEKKHRRRARKLGNGYEKYNLKDIYERDNWICGICKQLIDKDLQYPDPQSKSIDHIIPLSKGGPDTFENVQLTHLICNVSKGSKI
jgi:hypothetical protein